MNTHPNPSTAPMQPRPPVPTPPPVRADQDDHHGLMDAFHLPPTQAERHAVRLAAEQLVGPGGF